ncbi:hypothetical protein B0T17DRAFT_347175 [Bombardia bombarda]|uniref:Uncharacterized protein n=1 Tax=Bombardia bombarda TaxID=252184 RepID=A0AA39WHS0_9PEZI|nr:hypothetical protein B0T17DRAFT_347175 [Bombardia bombarda]
MSTPDPTPDPTPGPIPDPAPDPAPDPDPSVGVDQNVLLPLKVDAFVFNRAVCDAGGKEADSKKKAKIAPIAQPNYSFLRLDERYLQSDIMNDVDLHNAWPAQKNSRFTDLGTGEPRRNRQGVYIHWTMPRVYRSGKAVSDKSQDKDQQAQQKYPEVPTRWLIVRKIDDMSTIRPVEAATSGLKRVTAWILESDRMWDIDELDLDVDLQVDVSPFIKTDTSKIDLKGQAEVFIGAKTKAESWKETWRDSETGVSNKETSVRWVDLSLLSSSNQLFPDYQPHCSNVFSIVDNFNYGKGKFLEHASASYYVLGWHSKLRTDLFQPDEKEQVRLDKPRKELLSILNMKIKETVKDPKSPDGGDKPVELPTAFKNWLKADKPTFTLCHGAMYSVQWDVEQPPKNIPADSFAELINGTLPISVGTTPMDALMAYAGAHEDDQTEIAKVEKALKNLEEALLATDDGVESQAKASDMLYNWNYLRLDGGELFHLSGSDGGGKPTVPEHMQMKLIELNQLRRLADAVSRKLQRLRWSMFSEWWKFVTVHMPKRDQDKNKIINDAFDNVALIKGSISELEIQLGDIMKEIKVIQDADADKLFLAGTLPAFQQQRDPTLLVGGVKSGWEPDYLEPLKIRLDLQLGKSEGRPKLDKDGWEDVMMGVSQMPEKIIASATALLQEFVILENKRDGKENPLITDQAPLFHDTVGSTAKSPIWRDFWHDTQPWFPLFLEWEVEYTHVPDELWSLYENKPYLSKKKKLHFGIRSDVDLEEKNQNVAERDSRKLSGRVLILPQPSFSLRAKVKQLFDGTPSDKLNDLAPEAERTLINDNLHLLEFLSAPLAGFNSHMVTVEQGNHVKPSVKDPSGDLTFLEEAERRIIGLDGPTMASIGIESDVTPYGTSKKSNGRGFSVFKPVTHGQFKISKLNIIDKFGQAIHAVDPRITNSPQKVWPCISEWYQPQAKPDGTTPNIIETEKTPEYRTNCEYVQVPPQINQPTRLRATFVMPTAVKTSDETVKQGWRPANEWDNPIWGWVVVNYANSGLQLFLKDGTFYREVRLSGETGATASPEWLPFKKPDNPGGVAEDARQLSLLVAALTRDEDYLARFYKMLKAASATQDPMPSAYADFTNALVGRPLALANMGWALELATPELESQMADDMDKKDKYKHLLEINSPTGKPVYDFPVKLGDVERGFDGLVGYFNAKPLESLAKGDWLDLSQFFSHFAKGSAQQPMKTNDGEPRLVEIITDNYPRLHATYVDPTGKTAEAYDLALSETLNVFGALVNPFSAVHGYSGILPVKELALPTWTWASSMSNMTAFFHAGPVLVADDVPKFKKSRRLSSGKPVTVVEKPDGEVGVRLASTSMSQWVWLQPYSKDEIPPEERDEEDGEGNGEDETDLETYMPLAVDAPDLKARLAEGPYTALEGYLQMAPSVKKKDEEV